MLKTLVTIAAVFVGAAGAASAAGPGVSPGLYRLVVTGGDSKESKHCVTPAEAASTLGMDIPKTCHVTRSVYAGGKMALAFTCPGMTGSMQGSYTPVSYTFDTQVHITAGGQSLSQTNHIVATRISATCAGAGD